MADPPEDLDEVTRPAAPLGSRDLVLPMLVDRRRLGRAAATAVLVGGVALAGYAVLRAPAAPATELSLPMAGSASSVPAAPTTTATEELLVHAAGAVAAPGVHVLPTGSRVADLLAVAGGPSVDADLDRVNLAAPLADGERVWFPRLGDATEPVVAGSTAPATTSDAAGPVDLNSATAEQLDTLPGVGPATAAAIIEHRERVGPFTAIEGLLDVPGIGDAKLAQLRDLVTV